ncbi:MAG: hypothetical protein IH621_11105 [Krumholzibacteria bacterium]|nr:hypothetical protein [Candidatus Krumholzibacteria bacterium]
MSIRIVVIDGTGPGATQEYNQAMATSFCTQTAAALPNVRYYRGPTLMGMETDAIAAQAFQACSTGVQEGDRLVLAGYSRGGCAAILTAKRLKDAGRTVDSLFLFDAVDMQFSNAGLCQVIPDNVRYVAHARTARDLGFWVRNPIRSRFYFFNTGRWLAGTGTYTERFFVGTHAAVGGVPWSDLKGDGGCAQAVAEWMTRQLNLRGVPVQLRA